MFTLQQAIKLATKAHEDQWRKPYIFRVSEHGSREGINKYIAPDLVENKYTIHLNRRYSYDEDNILQMEEQYITHPLAVMNMMSTEDERIVAILHDVIEDTEWQLSEIISDEGNFYNIFYQPATDNGVFEQECYDISKSVYKALDALTKLPNQSYTDYLKGIASSKLATKVKLADMFHNMSDNPSEHAKQKYLKAIPILLQNL